MDDIFYELDKRRKWLESLPDGVPCDHVGCLSHISHPCESCGRIGGKRLTLRAVDGCKAGRHLVINDKGYCVECGVRVNRRR